MRVTLDGLLWSPRMSRGQSLQRMLTWPLASGLTAESGLRPEWSWIALNTCRLELQNLEWRRLWGKKTSESWRCGFVRSFDDFELARFQGAYGFRGTNWSIRIRRSSIARYTSIKNIGKAFIRSPGHGPFAQVQRCLRRTSMHAPFPSCFLAAGTLLQFIRMLDDAWSKAQWTNVCLQSPFRACGEGKKLWSKTWVQGGV